MSLILMCYYTFVNASYSGTRCCQMRAFVRGRLQTSANFSAPHASPADIATGRCIQSYRPWKSSLLSFGRNVIETGRHAIGSDPEAG